ncbi:MAG: transposase [Gammaproteobacteria bacterium]|jgi:transposase
MLHTERPMTVKTPGPPNETPDPQVKPKTTRRPFTNAYKLSILEQADQCRGRGRGEVGELLRREGLYSSHLSNWRELRRQGTRQANTNNKRGPQPSLEPAQRREREQLRRRNAKLEQELDKARTIIDVQKKPSSLLATDARRGPFVMNAIETLSVSGGYLGCLLGAQRASFTRLPPSTTQACAPTTCTAVEAQ